MSHMTESAPFGESVCPKAFNLRKNGKDEYEGSSVRVEIQFFHKRAPEEEST